MADSAPRVGPVESAAASRVTGNATFNMLPMVAFRRVWRITPQRKRPRLQAEPRPSAKRLTAVSLEVRPQTELDRPCAGTRGDYPEGCALRPGRVVSHL